MWIQFAFDAHRVNANSIRIQTESSVKGPLGLLDVLLKIEPFVGVYTIRLCTCVYNHESPWLLASPRRAWSEKYVFQSRHS